MSTKKTNTKFQPLLIISREGLTAAVNDLVAARRDNAGAPARAEHGSGAVRPGKRSVTPAPCRGPPCRELSGQTVRGTVDAGTSPA